MALQFGSIERVRGERRALEPVPDVGEVRDPAQVHWYRVERYKEPAEQ